MGFPYVPGDVLTPHLPEFRTEDGTHFNTLGSYACAAAYLPFLNRALQNRNI